VGFNEQFAGRILDTWWLTSRQSPQFASAQPRSADQPTTVATKKGSPDGHVHIERKVRAFGPD
jgi:hypothetical protein